jgi:hypothetical protein
VLRISIEPASETITFKLEGKVIGPWVTECDRAWTELQENHSSKKFRLDMRNVTFVDEQGTSLLRRIQRASGAEVLADSPLTRYFAERITRSHDGREKEGA